MMRKAAVLGLLSIVALCSVAVAGEVDLKTYVRLLQATQGETIESRQATLSRLGFRLSAQGMRELEAAAARMQFSKAQPQSSVAIGSARTWDYSSGAFSSGQDTSGAPRSNPSTARTSRTWSYSNGSSTVSMQDSRRAAPSYSASAQRQPTTSHASSSSFAPPSVSSARIGGPTYYGSGRATTGSGTRIGNTVFYNFSDGTSGTANRIGNTTFYYDNQGTSATTNQIGNMRFYNDNKGVTGTTSQIGNFGFHNYSNGVSGTSTKIGNMTFHNFNSGQNCTTTRIGTYTYTNCY